MYEIEMHEVSQEFARCWQAAGRHIERKAQGQLKSWLKANLNPPFLEHLSFRLGNQLFFLQLEDANGQLDLPGSKNGLLMIAGGCSGHACLMPMCMDRAGWHPAYPGWGLIDAKSGKHIDPVALVSDEKIEMTDWELHDFAVQVVRERLQQEDRKLMSWQGNPNVDPSIWLLGDHGPEWIVVRAVRYPERTAEPPANWAEISMRSERLSKIGHFASVCFANIEEALDVQGGEPPMPLWRGECLEAMFDGLVPGPGGLDA